MTAQDDSEGRASRDTEATEERDDSSRSAEHEELELATSLRIIAYFATISPVVISVLRTISLAEGDLETFTALLRGLDIIAILTSTVIAMWPAVIGVAMAVLYYHLPPAYYTAFGTGGFFFGLLSSGKVGLIAAIAGAILGVAMRGVALKVGDEHKPWRFFSLTFAVIIALQLVNALPASTASWIPTEVVSVTGRAPQTVYILNVDEKYTSILHYQGGLELVHNDQILNRQYCRLPESEFRMPYLRDGIIIFGQSGTKSSLSPCPLKKGR
ncbi:hypothetical protein [Actinomadura sp. B10D3]|uniref:hypothetical protein n=1 Tax=Actinomadura sp. B10D3 TaxID=3153557 RepID=UPI00325D8299